MSVQPVLVQQHAVIQGCLHCTCKSRLGTVHLKYWTDVLSYCALAATLAWQLWGQWRPIPGPLCRVVEDREILSINTA